MMERLCNGVLLVLYMMWVIGLWLEVSEGGERVVENGSFWDGV